MALFSLFNYILFWSLAPVMIWLTKRNQCFACAIIGAVAAEYVAILADWSMAIDLAVSLGVYTDIKGMLKTCAVQLLTIFKS